MMAASAPPELDAAACAAWLGRLGVGERGDERVRCAGRVTARRRHGGCTFVDVQLGGDDGGDGTGQAVVQLVLQRDAMEGERCAAFGALLRPGATVAAEGAPGCDREGSLSLYASSLTLLGCDAAPESVTRVVDLVAAGTLPREEAEGALGCDGAALAELLQLRAAQTATAPDAEPKAKKQRKFDFKQAVLRTSRALQGLPPREPRQRAPRLSKADAALLSAVESRCPCRPCAPPRAEHEGPAAAGVRGVVETLLKPSSSLRQPDACCCRGHGSRTDYLHGKKQPQVEWYSALVWQAAVRTASSPFGCVCAGFSRS